MWKVILGCVALAAVAASCTGSDAPACPDGTEPYEEYRLFMGRGGGDGEVVDDAAWEAFLSDTVTPRFPDGLTVLDARGQWRGSSGAIQSERSKVLLVLAPPGGDAQRLIAEIADEYIRTFQQESVLRVVGDTCASFS